MSHFDIYKELSNKVGTEQSRIVPEIWKTVCTLEEAEILALFPFNQLYSSNYINHDTAPFL